MDDWRVLCNAPFLVSHQLRDYGRSSGAHCAIRLFRPSIIAHAAISTCAPDPAAGTLILVRSNRSSTPIDHAQNNYCGRMYASVTRRVSFDRPLVSLGTNSSCVTKRAVIKAIFTPSSRELSAAWQNMSCRPLRQQRRSRPPMRRRPAVSDLGDWSVGGFGVEYEKRESDGG